MENKESKLLILAVFIAGLCSIIYELLIATASSYFLGDSITQFSLIIGSYMAAMGLGSYCSRLVADENLMAVFIRCEIALALLGGFSVPLLYLAFAFTDFLQYSSILLTLIIGWLIGLEIPFLSRLLAQHYQLKVNISNVLSIDYLGALIATLVFPFVLLPTLGVFKTSLMFGLVNMAIAVILLAGFRHVFKPRQFNWLRLQTLLAAVLLLAAFASSSMLLKSWNNNLYVDRIVYNEETPYQNIVMTKNRNDLRLFLNGNLQFSASDEYRYHEALVHTPLAYKSAVKRVLVLGGGDGLAVRELLKFEQLETIDLVDLDPAIHRLGLTNRHLVKLNQASLKDEKVTLIADDAYRYLKNNRKPYDLIIIDLPDPNNTAMARLYSQEFYRLVGLNLSQEGMFVTQATSPFFARKAFWTVYTSVAAAGFTQVLPYHLNVPSFGEWGFVLASKSTFDVKRFSLSAASRYLDEASFLQMQIFAKDIASLEVEVNHIDQPTILNLYISAWQQWN